MSDDADVHETSVGGERVRWHGSLLRESATVSGPLQLHAATWPPATQDPFLDSLQRFARLGTSLLSQGPIVEILTQPRLAPQIDLNSYPASRVIDKKPNSSNHAVPFLLLRRKPAFTGRERATRARGPMQREVRGHWKALSFPAAGALHRSASAIAPAATRPTLLTARPTRVPRKVVFSSRTKTASAATHATFITPPTNKRPISAQQQPTQ